MQPWKELLVGPAEYTDLKAQGVLLDDEPHPTAQTASAQAPPPDAAPKAAAKNKGS
jgi:hypothetical protein